MKLYLKIYFKIALLIFVFIICVLSFAKIAFAEVQKCDMALNIIIEGVNKNQVATEGLRRLKSAKITNPENLSSKDLILSDFLVTLLKAESSDLNEIFQKSPDSLKLVTQLLQEVGALSLEQLPNKTALELFREAFAIVEKRRGEKKCEE